MKEAKELLTKLEKFRKATDDVIVALKRMITSYELNNSDSDEYDEKYYSSPYTNSNPHTLRTIFDTEYDHDDEFYPIACDEDIYDEYLK